MTKKEIIITVSTVIALILLFAFVVWFGKTHKKPDPVPTSQQGNMVIDLNATDEELKQENPLASRQVYFAGIEDAVITKTGKIALENLPENEDFLLKYEIYNEDNGELIYESDLIPSGKRVYWTPGDTLPVGEYRIGFSELPYAPNPTGGDYIPLTQGKNVITLEIVDQ